MTTLNSSLRWITAMAILCGALLTTLPASAQSDKQAAPPKADIPPPPRPRNLDEPLDPVITIRKEGGNTMEEYRIGGRLYMIKVTPPVGAPYYLVDPNGQGGFSRVEGPVAPTAVPKWVIFQF